MVFFRILLFPFALLYNLITRFRNHLFDIGYKKSVSFDIPVICVGNLIAGGAGKTPMVEYLIELLKSNYQICTLSRGYGRKTKGFILADANANAETIGDEPYQIYQKFGEEINVAVGEERALAIPEILFRKENTNLILMDDAYQHRYVKAQFNILLTEYSRPFYNDFVLPMGLLRESRNGAERAQVIVVTKCPDDLKESDSIEMKNHILKYAPKAEVFFSSISYQSPVSFYEYQQAGKNILAVSGIAHPENFENYIDSSPDYHLINRLRFPDHHGFKERDILKIIDKAKKEVDNTIVLTTEKDYVRMKAFEHLIKDSGVPFFYLPIRNKLLFDANKFDKLVTDAIIAFQSNRTNED